MGLVHGACHGREGDPQHGSANLVDNLNRHVSARVWQPGPELPGHPHRFIQGRLRAGKIHPFFILLKFASVVKVQVVAGHDCPDFIPYAADSPGLIGIIPSAVSAFWNAETCAWPRARLSCIRLR